MSIILTFLLVGFYNQSYSCDIDKLVAIQENIEQLESAQVEAFILDLNQSCLENQVEYAELANQTLFMLLTNQSEMLLRALSDHSKTVDWVIINDMLSEPISDEFDLEKIRTVLATSSIGKKKVRKRMEKAIVRALEKQS